MTKEAARKLWRYFESLLSPEKADAIDEQFDAGADSAWEPNVDGGSDSDFSDGHDDDEMEDAEDSALSSSQQAKVQRDLASVQATRHTRLGGGTKKSGRDRGKDDKGKEEKADGDDRGNEDKAGSEVKQKKPKRGHESELSPARVKPISSSAKGYGCDAGCRIFHTSQTWFWPQLWGQA